MFLAVVVEGTAGIGGHIHPLAMLAEGSPDDGIREVVEIAGHDNGGIGEELMAVDVLKCLLQAQPTGGCTHMIQMHVHHAHELLGSAFKQQHLRANAGTGALLFKTGAGHIGRGRHPEGVHLDQIVLIGAVGNGQLLIIQQGSAAAAAADRHKARQIFTQPVGHMGQHFLKANDIGVLFFNGALHEGLAVAETVFAILIFVGTNIEGNKLHCVSLLMQDAERVRIISPLC